ncbi:MAG: 3-phosphoserine/phosphohydroxythreonine transaminase [Phycisphaerales bacterium]
MNAASIAGTNPAGTTVAAQAGAAAAINGRASSGRCFNFGAGPSVLPEEVLRQIQEDVWNYRGCGMGILEISHRGRLYDEIVAETDALIREIGSIPANYKVLFMTGGATGQNWLVPANLLPKGGTADYIVTGYWSEGSFKDAQQYAACHNPGGKIHLAGTSKDKNHSYIPADEAFSFSERPAYVHITTNNTIFGTQFRRVPRVPAGVPIVADASSDIFSGPIDVSKYGAIYGGAQKNMGTTGATFVIIRDELIEKASSEIPRMCQYRTFAKDESRPNTPPHFAVYTVGLMARWIKSQGGLAALQKKNEEKAGLIYAALDECAAFWACHARKEDRSLMNITFRAKGGEVLDDGFMKLAKEHGCDGLKGHRSTGGMRASTYNAFPREGCKVLADLIRDFAKKQG